MNKVLSRIATDEKLSKAVIMSGTALSIVSNLIIFVGVYYSGIRKGVIAMQVEVEDE